ncbi:adenosine receptor A3-like [Oculina patagonica]
MDANEEDRNLCSAPFMGTHALMFLVAINIFFAIASTLNNCVILVALHKESSLRPASKILLRSLALTDFFVGIVVEPLLVILLLTKEYESLELCYRISAMTIFTGQILGLVSLLTLTAISVDRLLALLLGMRYRQVVTSKRIRLTVICFWILGICFATAVFWNRKITLYYISIVVLLCIMVSTCSYIKIYQKLLYRQAQIHQRCQQGKPNGHEPSNLARYRKTVSSALWVQFAVVTCYLPMTIITVLMATRGMIPSLLVAWSFASTLMFFNSALNPILYCWKIREVRREVIDIIKQISCCLSS